MRMAAAMMAATCGRSEDGARIQSIDEAGVESTDIRLAAMSESQHNAAFIRTVQLLSPNEMRLVGQAPPVHVDK